MPIHLTCFTCGGPVTRRPSQATERVFCKPECYHGRCPTIIAVSEDGVTASIPLRTHSGAVRAYAIIDAADAEWAGQWRWCLDRHGYAMRNGDPVNGKHRMVYLHRELLGLPQSRDGREGDHIDRVPLNCRRSNLRIIPGQGNPQNTGSRRGAASAFRGVSWNKAHRKWQVEVQVNGKRHHIGSFTDECEAADAAREARTRLMPYALD